MSCGCCSECHEYVLLTRHDCLAWECEIDQAIEQDGASPIWEDFQTVYGGTTEAAAERAAIAFNEESAEYSMMSGNPVQRFRLRRLGTDDKWVVVKVQAEAAINYYTEEVSS